MSRQRENILWLLCMVNTGSMYGDRGQELRRKSYENFGSPRPQLTFNFLA